MSKTTTFLNQSVSQAYNARTQLVKLMERLQTEANTADSRKLASNIPLNEDYIRSVGHVSELMKICSIISDLNVSFVEYSGRILKYIKALIEDPTSASKYPDIDSIHDNIILYINEISKLSDKYDVAKLSNKYRKAQKELSDDKIDHEYRHHITSEMDFILHSIQTWAIGNVQSLTSYTYSILQEFKDNSE